MYGAGKRSGRLASSPPVVSARTDLLVEIANRSLYQFSDDARRTIRLFEVPL
jgi:hypothetical protein